MNKVININLGGKAVTIDDDAYEYLQQYISSLKTHFADYEEKDDIIYDIESRLGEIFHERLMGRDIVSKSDVQGAIEQMGRPEDFDYEDESANKEAPHSTVRENREKREKQSYHVGKKLMRDPDNKRIAGVLSGLSAYFGLGDPLYLRIAFILLFISGLTPMVYVVLWIVMPKPKTAADRLAMRGEDINYNNIAKEVHEEFLDLKDRLANIGR